MRAEIVKLLQQSLIWLCVKLKLLTNREIFMHIQIINFNLEGINRAEYEGVCNELAEAFAALPGLVSKHWLADEKNNTYGGVYIWETKEAYEAYLNSELFAGVGSNPALVNMVSKDFGVIEAPTRVTRGL